LGGDMGKAGSKHTSGAFPLRDASENKRERDRQRERETKSWVRRKNIKKFSSYLTVNKLRLR
jgi:hypothetical protein